MDQDSIRKLALGLAAVTEVIVYSVGGFFLGRYLDHRLEKTAPWITVFLTFFGLTLGFVRLYRIYIRDEQSNTSDQH